MLKPTSLARSFALGLLLAGCQVGDDPSADSQSDDVVVRADGYFTATRDLRRCAAPACGGYFMAPVNASSARCADGTTAASCYVAALDLTALGIGAASISGSVVYRGHIAAAAGRTPARFVASEAWRSATGAAATASVVRVSTTGTTCTFVPCQTLNMVRANSTAAALPVVGVDLTHVAGLADAARDSVLGAATRDDGALVAGVRTTMPGNPSTTRVPVLRATQAFVRVTAPAPTNLCGAALQADFAHATERLLFTSETDAPFTWFARDAVTALPADPALLALLSLPADTHVERTTLDQLLSGSTVNNDGDLPGDHRAARFRQLVQTINGELSNVTVYRVGTIQIRIFILGLDHCGKLAGLETLAVET